MPRYLPSLSTLIVPKDLPEDLGFIQNISDTLFDDVYFDHYDEVVSIYGEEKEYNLDIIIDKSLGIEIPGTSLTLLLNPPSDDDVQGETSFHVVLFYHWGILRFINNFNLAQFSFGKEDLIRLFLKICNIDSATLLEHIAIHIKNPTGTALNFIIYNEEELVGFFNAYYELTGTANELVYTNNTTFGTIEAGLAAAGITTDDVINDFGISTDYPNGTDTIEDVYARLNVEKDSDSLSIYELINKLNEDYSLTGTINEIIYTDNPETTYDDILSALNAAEITLLDLIIDYVIIDAETVNDILNIVTDFFVEAKEDTYGTEFYNLFTPLISTSINDLSLALSFPRSWLKPIDPVTNRPYEDEVRQTMLRFDVGALHYSTEGGLQFENESSFSFEKSEIGNTGMTLYFDRMKLDLSRTSTIPEAAAAGYPDDFVGVFVESAEIGLPEKWFQSIGSTPGVTLGIFGENLLLGTGGISGTFGLRAIDTDGNPTNGAIPQNAELLVKLGGENGLVIGFSHFDFTLQQGEFVDTNIHGSLQIPGFKDSQGDTAKIEIEMSFDTNGNFYITASEQDGFSPIVIPGVLQYTMKSLSVGRQEKNGSQTFFISTSGSLVFTGEGLVSQLFQDPLEIDPLIIWQDGTIELKGLDGAIKLPKPKVMQLGPAAITVTAVHFGTDERKHGGKMRKYWYFGFDGGISINPGGVDARGDGVKVYFTVDNNGSDRPLDVFFRIQSLTVDLIIPGSASRNNAAVIINGYLAMKEPAGDTKGTEYIGGISLDLPKLRLSASAGMRYNPSYPSFLIDVNLNLPTAIPIGPTGIGIYGFRGLLGQRYVASRPEAGVAPDGSWYEYYKAKVAPDYKEGIQVSKFAAQDGFSVGAGVSLATAFDGGKVFSAKVFLLLSLPEVLLIQGQGAILKERIGLDSTVDPPFSAMIAISPDSIESAFGVNIKIPDGGEIAKVSGSIEMGFFFNNAGAWYLNIGRDKPEEKRIRAEIFTLFSAYFYFMLSKQGIAAGAGARWDFNRKLGPLRIEAGAYLDVGGKIGFKPVQIGGSIALGGYAGVYVWKIGLRIEINAYLAAEAPKPFIITGGLSFKLKLPWPVKKLGGPYTLDFTWRFNKDRDLTEIPLIDPEKNVKAINRLTGEAFPLYYGTANVEQVPTDIDSYVIPVDSFIDVEFLKGMGLNAGLSKFGEIGEGAVYTEFTPPQKGKSEQVRHDFLLEDIQINYWNNTEHTWDTYDIYEAIRPKSSEHTESEIEFLSDTSLSMYGFWQCETPNKYNKLRILSKSPLSYLTHFTSGQLAPPEDFGYGAGFLFCEGKYKTKTCVTFPQSGQEFVPGIFKECKRMLFRIAGKQSGVVLPSDNPFNLENALCFQEKIDIFFAEPQALVDIKLSSFADEVIITYYRRAQSGYGFSQLPLYEYIEIAEEPFIPQEPGESRMIAYKHTDHNDFEVEKITIESIGETVYTHGLLMNESGGELTQENTDGLLLEDAVSFRAETRLFGICMMNVADYNFNLQVKNQDYVDQTNQAMREGFETQIEPIWRPDTAFRITIRTKDNLPKDSRSYTNTYRFFFKTAGVVGHFHQYNPTYLMLAEKGLEDQYRLATLKPYIDYSRSYPNADGRLINAKPLFYQDPVLLVFYKQNTVHAMFNNFDQYGSNEEITSELQVLIKDPTELLSSDADNPTQAHIGENNWVANPEPAMTPEVRLINNLALGGVNCSGYAQMKPLAVAQEIKTGELQPDKLYTAVFNAVYKQETAQVHSYVFKTSQYKNFEEQVQSCLLRDENGDEVRKAVFSVEKTLDADALTLAGSLLNGTLPTNHPLISQYANVFDRLTDGILQIGVLPPAVTTDFNIIKNGSTIIGIIVRNPEPFNNPKIPEEALQDTIQISTENTPADAYNVIFSQDKTQAFIGNAAMNIPAGNVIVTFRYKQYHIYKEVENGVEKSKVGYETKAEETVSFDM
jgi:hypothetical protein